MNRLRNQSWKIALTNNVGDRIGLKKINDFGTGMETELGGAHRTQCLKFRRKSTCICYKLNSQSIHSLIKALSSHNCQI